MNDPNPRPEDEPDIPFPEYDPDDGYIPANEPALEGDDVPDTEEPCN